MHLLLDRRESPAERRGAVPDPAVALRDHAGPLRHQVGHPRARRGGRHQALRLHRAAAAPGKTDHSGGVVNNKSNNIIIVCKMSEIFRTCSWMISFKH